MICIIALVVFGILAIFSAAYRPVAKEAFECVFRRVTLRKCTTGLDKRLKAQITGRVMKRSLGLGSFLYKYFEVFSWMFTILLVLSVVYSAIGLYNLAVYDNCNGEQGGVCILTGEGTIGADCEIQECPGGCANSSNCNIEKCNCTSCLNKS